MFFVIKTIYQMLVLSQRNIICDNMNDYVCKLFCRIKNLESIYIGSDILTWVIFINDKRTSKQSYTTKFCIIFL